MSRSEQGITCVILPMNGRFGSIKLCRNDSQVSHKHGLVTVMLNHVSGVRVISNLILIIPKMQ